VAFPVLDSRYLRNCSALGFTLAADPDRRDALKQELERILPLIVDEATDKVILFGSLARDSVGRTTDIDLIVVRRTTQPFVQRSMDLMSKTQPRFAMDVLVYTPEELAELRESSFFVRGAIRAGKVVYER